jgi:hypothetical protein
MKSATKRAFNMDGGLYLIIGYLIIWHKEDER